MTANIFLWSDQHFLHRKIYDAPFPAWDDHSKPMRPFSCAEEADEYMIEQYNKTVKPNDKVYWIGDISLAGKKGLSLMRRMQKGHNYLVLGNHDVQAPIEEYKKYFNQVYGCLYMKDIKAIVSHMPVHPNLLSGYRFDYNIHGHTHDHFVYLPNGKRDLSYINVSVEVTGYKPVHIDELMGL